MYRVTMDVLCLNGYSEVPSGDVENTALVIEDLVALILLDLFGIVVVDGVKVTHCPAASTQQSFYTFQVQAVCPTEVTTTRADSLDTLEVMFENAICCALIELFSTVLVNKIVVRHERNVALDIAALPRSA